MTEGEKMVWAAAFIQDMDRLTKGTDYRDEPDHVAIDNKLAATAAEYAWSRVVDVRESLDATIATWGPNSGTAQAHREMVGKDRPPKMEVTRMWLALEDEMAGALTSQVCRMAGRGWRLHSVATELDPGKYGIGYKLFWEAT